MKFSDQKIGYYNPDTDATVWLPIQEYVRRFPNKVGIRNAVPGTNRHRTFTLPHAIDISTNPCAKERAAYYEEKIACAYITRGEGVLLDVANMVEATVIIDIDWGG